MKAVMMPEYNVLELREIPVPEYGPDEVLVRIRATGICGSDVHGLDGSTGRRIPPLVMGHEASGTIEAVGVNVAGYLPGDHVTFDSTIYCGTCRACRNGDVNFCENRQVLGVACDEYSRQGTFAEFAALPSHILYKIPLGLSFAEAAMIEPLSVAVHAVSITPVALADTALVIGAGVIGLMTLQVLLHAGCSRVIVVDIDPRRLKKAEQMGAWRTVDSRHADPEDAISRMNGSKGADVSFDAVGLADTVRSSINALRRGGTATIIGNLTPEVGLPLQMVVSRQLRIQGSNASSGEYPACIRMMESGQIDVKSLISRVAPLEEADRWFRELASGGGDLWKVILDPTGGSV
ncbi:MAG: galactitol-1-phosphate 5-dehydrogenase [Spirochaetaceae bacterium]|nr:galactitol-1-phosphate 5-dehydrogenase [Spirochaetaceae bacterium]MDT8296670.1 galactitol-1-phosphate 5-dehydrogenase [Spirochaetaceae bacterium]